jgi:PAS domain S-box-containing protein
MRIARDSIGYRILLPVFVLVVGFAAVLLLLVARTSGQVREDYHRFTVTASSSQVKAILDLAAAELTAARLTDNPIVVGAKKQTVREAIERFWARGGLGGVIAADDGSIVTSTQPPQIAHSLVLQPGSGYFAMHGDGLTVHAYAESFPLWGWRVFTVADAHAAGPVRREVLLLLPLLLGGVLALAAGLFAVLWANLRRPVAEMARAVAEERELPATGIAEFDAVGRAVNDALWRVRDRSEALTRELVERHRTEVALRDREEHIRLLLASTAEGIYGIDPQGVCTFCNPACLRMLGRDDAQELLGKNVHDLVHHTRADGTAYPAQECRVHQAYRSEQGVHVEDEMFWRRDGTGFPVEYWSHPVVAGDKVTGAVVAFVDITERRQSEELLRNILKTVDEGFMVVDREFTILLANRALGEMVASTPEQLVGRRCHEVFHLRQEPCADAGQPCLLRRVFESGQPESGEHVHRRGAAGEARVELHAYPVRGPGDRVATAIVTMTDVTEKAGLEQQLRQSQKMEAVGRLAGGIAHDFNNMLMAIVGYASLAREAAPAGSKERSYNDQVLAAAEKAADLTRQILAFSRKQVMSPQPIDLNGVVLGMGGIITRLLGEDIEVVLNLAAGSLVALADRAQIEQVLMNLCTNARDAMPAGGRLAIGTRALDCDRETAEAHGLELAGRHALITVSDSGVGMDELTRSQIFEPFFTTKELGKGTGLGLSIVYGIVKQHHGQIAVYSEPGRGTTFRIYLPLSAESPAAAPSAAGAAPSGGGETLLLAEDNPDVCELAQGVLESAGYRVLVARDGEEAVRLFERHGDEVALCLFDVVMPHLSGPQALARIKALRPQVRAIFMSGYAADIAADGRQAALGATYLGKPFLPREMLQRVREVLDARSPGAAG